MAFLLKSSRYEYKWLISDICKDWLHMVPSRRGLDFLTPSCNNSLIQHTTRSKSKAKLPHDVNDSNLNELLQVAEQWGRWGTILLGLGALDSLLLLSYWAAILSINWTRPRVHQGTKYICAIHIPWFPSVCRRERIFVDVVCTFRIRVEACHRRATSRGKKSEEARHRPGARDIFTVPRHPLSPYLLLSSPFSRRFIPLPLPYQVPNTPSQHCSSAPWKSSSPSSPLRPSLPCRSYPGKPAPSRSFAVTMDLGEQLGGAVDIGVPPSVGAVGLQEGAAT